LKSGIDMETGQVFIPKVIHYCWFGGNPLPEDALRCIESWKKFCPDYEIIEWNESNTDLNSCDYVREAYQAKKWAFVSDFVRFQVLYEKGGVYFDTDVELIKPIDSIIEKGPFMGIESFPGDYVGNDSYFCLNPGQGLAAEKGNEFYSEVISHYKSIHFLKEDGTMNLDTVGMHVTSLMLKYGLKPENSFQTVCGINIYPKEYFNPLNANSGMVELTENTVSIHHYAGTWVSSKTKIRDKSFQFIYRVFGEKAAASLKKLYRKLF